MAAVPDSKIGSIAVIGAGELGQGIARLAALGGFSTILEDILPASLRRAGNEISIALGHALTRGAITPSAAEAALARIEYASSLDQAARAADLIIEAVPDEFESKTEILTLLDKVSRPATIFASTSVASNISELAAITYRPGKILGMRFLSPDDSTWSLEIVCGRETDDETVAACTEAGRKMGLTVVVTKT